MFFFLEFLVRKLFFDKNYWFQLLSTKNDWIISLLLILVTLYSLSFNHSTMSSIGKETSFGFWWKACCYSSPSHLTRENFVSQSDSFFLLLFIRWPIQTTTANFQGLIHSNPAKCANQVTLSNEHMNYLFWA